MPDIHSLLQICWVTRDADRLVASFADHLGIGPWKRWNYTDPAIFNTTYHGDSVPWTMNLSVAWVGRMQVEIIEPTSGPTPHGDFLDRHGAGIQHVMISPKDSYSQAVSQFAALGHPLLASQRLNIPVRLGPLTLPAAPRAVREHIATRAGYVDTADTLGTVLELASLPPGFDLRRGTDAGVADSWYPATSTSFAPRTPESTLDDITGIGVIAGDPAATAHAWRRLTGVGEWRDTVTPVGRLSRADAGDTSIEILTPDPDGPLASFASASPRLAYLPVTSRYDASTLADRLGGTILHIADGRTWIDATDSPLRTVLAVLG